MPLILLSNSIGEPKDIPVRALENLRAADLLVFEEDKSARQALKAACIHKNYLKHNEHHDQEVLDEVNRALKNQLRVCYMSDQGMPGIADPGHKLVDLAFSLGSVIEVIPGPSSITSALALYPKHLHEYYYAGFLPRESTERIQKLKSLSKLNVPILILDTPYRLNAVLEDVAKVFGGTRKCLLAIEIGNTEQSYYWQTLDQLKKVEIHKKNFVLVVSA